jgi:DNA topoisomerase IB
VSDEARIARVAQQLRNLADLHGRELQTLADQLEVQGVSQLAERVRVFRSLQTDEIGAAVRELDHLSGGAAPAAQPDQDTAQPLTRRELLNLGGEGDPE